MPGSRKCSKCGTLIEWDENKKYVRVVVDPGKGLCDECINILRDLK